MGGERVYKGLLAGVLLLATWLVLATIGFMKIEGWNLVDSLYMSVITISTVGFKEVHPLSPEGKLFASVVIVAGLGTAVYTFTRLGQLVLEGELVTILGRRKMRADLERLEGHTIVCGYGRIGRPVVDGMKREGAQFCVIDREAKALEGARSTGVLFVEGDATDEEVLHEAGVERARVLMALLPSDPDNLYLTITAKSIHPKIVVIARAGDEKAEMRLKRGGADRVVSPYQMAALRVLHSASRPTVVDLMELVTHRQHMELRMEEFRIGPTSALAGGSIAESEIRPRYGVIVVAIKKESGEMRFNPGPGERLEIGDTIVVIGMSADISKIEVACASPGAHSSA